MMGYAAPMRRWLGVSLCLPVVTTYQMQASAILRFIKEKEKGSLEGKKIVFLYHDSAYGKEPIVALQEEAKLNKFELTLIPVAHPATSRARSG